jgi:hypothetical protein
MKYVRFTGGLSIVGGFYEDYLAFEDDTPIAEIKKHSLNYAIENAKKYDHEARKAMNITKEEYLALCISFSDWQIVSEEEFIKSLS